MRQGVGKALELAVRGEAEEEVKGRRSESAFSNPVRRRMFEFLTKHPCSSISEVARGVGQSPSAARWHLKKLVEAGHIAEIRHRKRLVYYPKDLVVREDADILATLSIKRIKETYLAILRSKGITQAELGELLGVSHQSVSRYTSLLKDLGLIVTMEDGRFTRYYPTPLLGEKREVNQPRERAFGDALLRSLAAEGLNPEVVRRTAEELMIKLKGAPGAPLLKVSTDPFGTVLI